MSEKRIVAIVQARVGSSRLPGKIFADICGKPMLQRVVERVRKAKLLDDVVVTTSFAEEDYQIVRWCQASGIPVYRGGNGVNDVLGRYYDTAIHTKADVIVRITADCPMIEPEVIDRCIALLQDTKSPFLSNVIEPTFPDGLDCEIFTIDFLELSHREARKPSEREHVTPWMIDWMSLNKEPQHTVGHGPSLAHHRWTVDEPADLDFVRAIYQELGEDFGMEDVLALLERKPELVQINAHIGRNEGYRKSLEADIADSPTT